jgi:hypothetical protein
MIENVMHTLGGVGLYGIISICLFFAVFVGVLVWTVGLKPGYLKAMQELPLADADPPHAEPESAAKPGERYE